MRRVLFYVRGIPIYSYPAMLYVGLVAGVVAGNIAAHVAGLDTFRVFIATFLLIIPSLIGARLLYVASHGTFTETIPRRVGRRFTIHHAISLLIIAVSLAALTSRGLM